MASVKKSANVVALGKAMRSARRERGHNQESFAAMAGLDRSYYGAVERGEFNVTVETVAKIAGGLHLSVSELFTKARL
jgi:transcriptional regulator with XRE-family HTH domain